MKKTTIVLSLVIALVLVVGWAAAADRPSEQGSLGPSTGRIPVPNSAEVDQNPDIRAHGEAFYELFEIAESTSVDQNPDIRAHGEAFYELFEIAGSTSVDQNPDIRAHGEAFYELFDVDPE